MGKMEKQLPTLSILLLCILFQEVLILIIIATNGSAVDLLTAKVGLYPNGIIMNYPSDEEVDRSYKNVITNNLFYQKRIVQLVDDKDRYYETYRDDLFYRLFDGWNANRVKNGYKPLSKARLASAINRNPFLKKDDGELLNLIKECEAKGNYKKAQWILFSSKKKNE